MLLSGIASLLCESPVASHTAASVCVAARLVGSPTYIGKMRTIGTACVGLLVVDLGVISMEDI